MKKIIIILLLLVFPISLFGCTDGISLDSYNNLIDRLEEMEFDVIAEDTEKDILQGQRKWLTINEIENVAVYIYESNEEMEKDASYIDRGGTSYTNGENAVEISWVSLPHFYKKDNIIVLYVGEDSAIIKALTEIMGVQFAGYVSHEAPNANPTDIEDDPDPLGLELTSTEVTPEGLTIVFIQSGGNPKGDLQTGSYYWLERLVDDKWIPVEMLPSAQDVGWTAEAYIINKEDETEWEVNWEWLYGKLPEGNYRIGKEIMDFQGTGVYDILNYYADFDIVD